MREFIEMDWGTWATKFKPVMNDRGEDMWDTHDPKIREVDPLCIWTLVDADDGGTVIVEGWHFVNRLGYYVTEKPYDEDAEYNVDYCVWEEDEGEEA